MVQLNPACLVHWKTVLLEIKLKQLATLTAVDPTSFSPSSAGQTAGYGSDMAGAAVKAESIPVDLHAVALFNLEKTTQTSED